MVDPVHYHVTNTVADYCEAPAYNLKKLESQIPNFHFPLTMKPTRPTPNHQILTMINTDIYHSFLLTEDASVTFEIARTYPTITEVRRNNVLIATIRWGFFARVGLNMSRDDQHGSQKGAKATWRMGWRVSLGGTPPKFKWRGAVCFQAIQVETGCIVATYDMRNGAFELKGSLGLENGSDADINELVATWVIHEHRERDIERGISGTDGYPQNRPNGSYKKLATPFQDDSKAVKTIRTTTQTLTSPGNDATATRGTKTAPGGKLVIDGVRGTNASASEGFGSQKMVIPYQDDSQAIKMKDAMTQTDHQPPDYQGESDRSGGEH